MKRQRKYRRQRGGVILENLIGMCFLLFLCFAVVELFMMIGRQMVIDYSSFYGAKALALGYARENCYKATRVAASGISGKDISTDLRVPLQQSSPWIYDQLRLQASRYMSLGRGSGVEYEYWYTTKQDEPRYDWSLSPFRDTVSCTMKMENPPFLITAMRYLMNLSTSYSGSGREPEPEGTTRMFNYAKRWMWE